MYYDYASGFDRDKMLVEIGKRYYLKLMEEAGLDASASDKKKMELAKQVLEYNKKLDQLESDVIQEMYLQAIQGDFTDTKIELDPAEAKKIVASRRVNTVDRIKRASKSLMKLVDDGKISFKELPQEIL
jgi:outer membrane murein-binding lipoprotein Lpp